MHSFLWSDERDDQWIVVSCRFPSGGVGGRRGARRRRPAAVLPLFLQPGERDRVGDFGLRPPAGAAVFGRAVADRDPLLELRIEQLVLAHFGVDVFALMT